MHTRTAYDVTQLRYLRRVGEVQPAPFAACAATVQRCSKVKLLKRVFMMQMCDALQLVGPEEEATSSTIDKALRELDAVLGSRSEAANALQSAMEAAPVKAEAITTACFAVLRTSKGGAGPGPAPEPAPSPAPAPPPPSAPTVESVYRSLFDGLPAGVAGSSIVEELGAAGDCTQQERIWKHCGGVSRCVRPNAARLDRGPHARHRRRDAGSTVRLHRQDAAGGRHVRARIDRRIGSRGSGRRRQCGVGWGLWW